MASAADANYSDPAVMVRLLTSAPVWAIVGLSTNTRRAAHGVAEVLARRGRTIVAIHPRAETVHGARGYATLAQVPMAIDVVDCFVNSQKVGDVVDQAIAVGAKAVWLQLGVIDEAAAGRAKAAGLEVVMNACPAQDAVRFGL